VTIRPYQNRSVILNGRHSPGRKACNFVCWRLVYAARMPEVLTGMEKVSFAILHLCLDIAVQQPSPGKRHLKRRSVVNPKRRRRLKRNP